MPPFTIIPTYYPSKSFDLIAPDTAEMLNQISERGWQSADIDGVSRRLRFGTLRGAASFTSMTDRGRT
jgi:hypothetical protein